MAMTDHPNRQLELFEQQLRVDQSLFRPKQAAGAGEAKRLGRVEAIKDQAHNICHQAYNLDARLAVLREQLFGETDPLAKESGEEEPPAGSLPELERLLGLAIRTLDRVVSQVGRLEEELLG